MIRQDNDTTWTNRRGIAAHLGVAERTIQDWERNLGLPHVKAAPGRNSAVRYHRPSVDEWMLGRMEGSVKK